MKLLKLLPLLLMLAFFNSNAHAAKNCGEIKGNIVGKMFCKVTSGSGSSIDGTETTKKKRSILGWKRPEWTKRKKN